MKENYKKLTSPYEFSDDEPVEFAAVDEGLLPGPIEQNLWVHISERLWSRILFFGSAYCLHFSQTIEPVIDTVLRPEQCESMLEELEFLMGVVNDAALLEALSAVRREAKKVIRRNNMRLVISPP